MKTFIEWLGYVTPIIVGAILGMGILWILYAAMIYFGIVTVPVVILIACVCVGTYLWHRDRQP